MQIRSIYNRLVDKVKEMPEQCAIVYEDMHINYNTFFQMVNNCLKAIEEQNVHNQGIVIALPRGPLYIASLFAVMKSGNFYIPLDLSYPKERIDYIVEHSKASFLVTDNKNKEKFLNKKILIIDKNISTINTNINFSTDKLNEVAYCLYTSGSTGYPKGVLVSEEALLNFINGMKQTIMFGQSKSILCTTTECFDIFFLESIMALVFGFTVVLSNSMEGNNPKKIGSLIVKNSVDIIQMTPSRLRMLIEYDKNLDCLKHIKIILVGGENFPLSLLKILQENTRAKIYNMYGPTETTIWSSVCDLTDRNEITIGVPILNTQFFILDNENNKLSAGNIGQLAISGLGLAKGYIYADELTKERFITINNGERVYLTGDLVKQDIKTKEYVYIGRMDNQIKWNGYRIELEEIEKSVQTIEEIKQCVVVPIQNENGEIEKLDFFYIADDIVQQEKIIGQMRKLLPDYMIPQSFTKVEQLQYTLNGKVDRNTVPKVTNISVSDGNKIECYQDERGLKKEIYKIITELTGIVIRQENHNHILTQINSLNFVKILVKLEEKYNIEIDVEYLSVEAYSSIDDVCFYIEQLVQDKEDV